MNLVLQNNTSSKTKSPSLSSQRVDAFGAISFKQQNDTTRLDKLRQSGSAKIKFPKAHEKHTEAILVNTAGGLTGGDKLRWDIRLGDKTTSIISTQACEKIYRSLGESVSQSTNIHLEGNSRLHWLPQETIVYNNARLSRNLIVEMDEAASFLGVEAVILGRAAMGEKVNNIWLKDRWRIYRGGKLLHAEDILIENNMHDLSHSPAALDNNTAFATLVYAGSEDMQFKISECLKLLSPNQTLEFGISQFENKTVCRFLSKDSYSLRKRLLPILQIFRNNIPLPAVWST